MVASFDKVLLSSSSYGDPILVSATSIGTGNTIHTAHASLIDEVWIWASNTDTSAREITIGWGGTTAAYQMIDTIAAKDSVLIIPGIPCTNSLVIKAAASVTNVIYIHGFVNRITNGAIGVSKVIPSGSTDGAPLAITSAASWTTFHTSTSSSTLFDEAWLWGCNIDASTDYDVDVDFAYGAKTITKNIVHKSGLTPLCPGFVFNGSHTARVQCATANVINIFGYINREQ